MRIVWICAVAACLTAPGLVRAEAPRETYAAISGVVLNDATGSPIRRAVLTLSTLDATPLEAVTFSESNGAFGFTSIPPGKYQLSASLEGFQSAWFGAATPSRAPGTLTLAAGDVRYGITFRLRPLGSISGVVLDPEGDPLPNAQMRLLKAAFSRLKPAYENQGFAISDDRGRYHFSDVVPGQYIAFAAQSPGSALLMQPEAAVGQNTPAKMYGVQFYSDAGRLSAATPVALEPGKDLDGIDFHLIARAAAAVHGRVIAPADTPGQAAAMIAVYSQDVPDSGEQTSVVGASGPNFEFEINNLTAGSYVIDTKLSVEGRDYRAVERVELPPGGQEITLRPERAIDLAGRVDLEGAERTSPFKVVLVPGGYPPGRGPIETETKPDGSFAAHNVVPGIWDIDVGPVPSGGFIKAMRLGEQDVLTEDMTIEPTTRESLHVVVSTRGAVVSGTVTVPQGLNRSARARVLLAPSGKYAQVLSFYAETSADESGHFEFKGVTPGKYKLYAFEELQPAAYDDPGYLKAYEKLSEAFDVAEGAHVERETQLILVGTQAADRE
jgi:protocatechuate 3,4-dioxygenase beta subunit